MRTVLLAVFASLAFDRRRRARIRPPSNSSRSAQSPGPGVVRGTATPVAEPASGGPPIVAVERAGEEIGAYVVTEHTRIYVDRSQQGLPNLVGTHR